MLFCFMTLFWCHSDLHRGVLGYYYRADANQNGGRHHDEYKPMDACPTQHPARCGTAGVLCSSTTDRRSDRAGAISSELLLIVPATLAVNSVVSMLYIMVNIQILPRIVESDRQISALTITAGIGNLVAVIGQTCGGYIWDRSSAL